MKLLVRTISFLALALVVGAAAFALTSPQSGQVEARENVDAHENCAAREVPLDEGYGVTRIEMREVCTR